MPARGELTTIWTSGPRAGTIPTGDGTRVVSPSGLGVASCFGDRVRDRFFAVWGSAGQGGGRAVVDLDFGQPLRQRRRPDGPAARRQPRELRVRLRRRLWV